MPVPGPSAARGPNPEVWAGAREASGGLGGALYCASTLAEGSRLPFSTRRPRALGKPCVALARGRQGGPRRCSGLEMRRLRVLRIDGRRRVVPGLGRLHVLARLFLRQLRIGGFDIVSFESFK